MDFSAFSNPHFDPVKWTDAMLAERAEEESLDAFLASLTMKLHVVSQDYTDQLEGGMVDAASMMPRCLNEISRAESVLKSLESEMASLAVQLQEFDQRNISGVEDLSRLDTLKLNMEKCKATLEEHARWSQLVREAKAFLESGGRFTDSADRVEILSNSLEILQCMPGHDDRMQTFKSLTETLISSLQPVVLQEVMGNNIASLRESLYVYRKIKRSDDFIDIYTTYRPQKLESVCNNCFKSSIPSKNRVPEFYGHIYGFLCEESENISTLFGDEDKSDLLCILLHKIMTPLHEAMLQNYEASEYTVVEEFSRRISPLLCNATPENLLKAFSSVYSCFLESPNMLLNSEGKDVRSALDRYLESVELATGPAQSTDRLTDTGLDVDDVSETADSEDAKAFFENIGKGLVTAVESSCKCVEHSLERSISFLGGLRARRYLRFLVPLFSQHLRNLASRIEDIRAASGLSITGGADTSGTPNKKQSSREDSSALVVMKRYGVYDLGVSRGHVLLPCALQVFKAASAMNRQFLVLERTASEQLEKVHNVLFNEFSLKEIVTTIASYSTSSNHSATKTGKYTASSSSRDQIMSIGSALAAIELRKDAEAESELKAFLSASTRLTVSSVTQSVFSQSLNSLIKLKSCSESFLFDLATLAPDVYLKDLSLDNAWGDRPVTNEEGCEETVDEDSLLPQHAFTQVGEHLLSLLQELEIFASATTVSDLIRFSDDADGLISQSWKPLKAILQLPDDDGYRNLSKRATCFVSIAKVEQAMFGISESTEGIVDLTAGDILPSLLEADDADDEDDVLRFVNEWLRAISDYCVGVLLTQICQIPLLSPVGRAQLRVDLTYLNNVINALGLSRHPFLSHLVLFLQQDLEKLSTQLEFIPVSSSPLCAVQQFDMRILDAIKSFKCLKAVVEVKVAMQSLHNNQR